MLVRTHLRSCKIVIVEENGNQYAKSYKNDQELQEILKQCKK